MSTACTFPHPLVRDGVSQRQRAAPGLDPASAKLDDRGVPDLLAFLLRYAALLRYYDSADQPAGDWVDFLARDASAIVVAVGRHDAAAVRTRFLARRTAADAAVLSDLDWPVRYAALVGELIALGQQFDEWCRRLPALALRAWVERLIRSTLAEQLRGAQAEQERLRALGLPVPDIAAAFPLQPWPSLAAAADPRALPSGWPAPPAERSAAVARLAGRFERMHEAMVATVAKARTPVVFEETLTAYSRHSPDMAVVLAFLGLYGRAQSELNAFTGRHLDFYYREVLQLATRPAIPDRVHLVFELAKHASSTLLPAGTVLDAGKDGGAKPKPLEYVTEREIAVNAARIEAEVGLKTVFVKRDDTTGEVRNIYAAPRADSADGLGAPLEGDEQKWLAFGDQSMPYATIGFAIASPMFELAEGERVIKVRLAFLAPVPLPAGKTAAILESELRNGMAVQASGAKGWLDLEVTNVVLTSGADGITSVQLVLRLAAEMSALVAYAEKALQAGYATTLPVVRCLLRNEALAAGALADPERAQGAADYTDEAAGYDPGAIVRYQRELYEALTPIDQAGYRPAEHPLLWRRLERAYPYEALRRAEVERIEIELDVDGVRGLVVETDAGLADPAKPFHPFGTVPRAGSALRVGSAELFRKDRIDEVTFHVEWSGLPETTFAAHYANYGVTGVTSARFTATPAVLENGRWEALSGGARALFTATGDVPQSTRTLTLTDPRLQGDPALEPFDRLRPGQRSGFLRLALDKSFLHERYPSALATQITGGHTLPLQPYTPLIASLTLDYRASAALEYRGARSSDFGSRTLQLFQIAPFGSREIFPIADEQAGTGVPVERRLLPQFEVGDGTDAVAEGTLYLGVAGFAPPQNLAVLFQVAEGSEDPELPVPGVTWSYLAEETWRSFGPVEIPSDSSIGLLASGVVEFAAPKAMTPAVSLLPAGLHWLRATVPAYTGAIPRRIGIHAQAVTAVFRDAGNDPGHLAAPLKAGTIAKLKQRNATIKAVTQPYASFGARMAETDDAFRPRAAERLRHKGQPVALFDYERLVLDRFPEVYKAKCISHTTEHDELAAGHVKVVVVPDLRNRNAVDPLRPRLSLAKLEAIRGFLQPLASDFAAVEVTNPSYEEIRARFGVRLKPGRDRGLYAQTLNDDLVRFLSPWLYDEALDLTLGGRIHRSDILEFIDGRDYVDFVVDFRLDHIVDGVPRVDVEEARATSASAALVSAGVHQIDTDVASCDDAPPSAPPGPPAPALAPTPPLPPWAKRYLGNTRSREIHDLEHLQPACQVAEIRVDRRYYFARTDDALAMGYDFCAYCFGAGASQR